MEETLRKLLNGGHIWCHNANSTDSLMVFQIFSMKERTPPMPQVLYQSKVNITTCYDCMMEYHKCIFKFYKECQKIFEKDSIKGVFRIITEEDIERICQSLENKSLITLVEALTFSYYLIHPRILKSVQEFIKGDIERTPSRNELLPGEINLLFHQDATLRVWARKAITASKRKFDDDLIDSSRGIFEALSSKLMTELKQPIPQSLPNFFSKKVTETLTPYEFHFYTLETKFLFPPTPLIWRSLDFLLSQTHPETIATTIHSREGPFVHIPKIIVQNLRTQETYSFLACLSCFSHFLSSVKEDFWKDSSFSPLQCLTSIFENPLYFKLLSEQETHSILIQWTSTFVDSLVGVEGQQGLVQQILDFLFVRLQSQIVQAHYRNEGLSCAIKISTKFLQNPSILKKIPQEYLLKLAFGFNLLLLLLLLLFIFCDLNFYLFFFLSLKSLI